MSAPRLAAVILLATLVTPLRAQSPVDTVGADAQERRLRFRSRIP